ncbi:MAG: transcriptional regulator, partial [Mesorhizobium sp.]
MNKIDRRRPESEMDATVNAARLGTRLRLARQTRGMTLKALATAAN